MATRCARSYFSVIADSYLKKALGPSIEKIAQDPYNYEIDQSKFPNGPPEENLKRMKSIISDILNSIEYTLPEIPFNMRKFFHMLSGLVNQRFPKQGAKGLGSFFFLRYICPIICVPHKENLMHSPPSLDVAKALVSVAKVVQSISNSFTAKQTNLNVEMNNGHHAKREAFPHDLATKPLSNSTDSTSQQVNKAEDTGIKRSILSILSTFGNQKQTQIERIFRNLALLPQSAPPDAKQPPFSPILKSKAICGIFHGLFFTGKFEQTLSKLCNDPRAKPELVSQMCLTLREVYQKAETIN